MLYVYKCVYIYTHIYIYTYIYIYIYILNIHFSVFGLGFGGFGLVVSGGLGFGAAGDSG